MILGVLIVLEQISHYSQLEDARENISKVDDRICGYLLDWSPEKLFVRWGG
jgi:hypothetical protein